MIQETGKDLINERGAFKFKRDNHFHRIGWLAIRAGTLSPATFIVLTNEPFTVTNTSEVLYNVHLRFTKSIQQNISLAGAGPFNRKVILVPKEELFARVSEDLHRLDGFICVVENPFCAVTDATGAFKISGLPPGRYTLQAAHWRNGLGRPQRDVILSTTNATVRFELPFTRANPF